MSEYFEYIEEVEKFLGIELTDEEESAYFNMYWQIYYEERQ